MRELVEIMLPFLVFVYLLSRFLRPPHPARRRPPGPVPLPPPDFPSPGSADEQGPGGVRMEELPDWVFGEKPVPGRQRSTGGEEPRPGDVLTAEQAGETGWYGARPQPGDDRLRAPADRSRQDTARPWPQADQPQPAGGRRHQNEQPRADDRPRRAGGRPPADTGDLPPEPEVKARPGPRLPVTGEATWASALILSEILLPPRALRPYWSRHRHERP